MCTCIRTKNRHNGKECKDMVKKLYYDTAESKFLINDVASYLLEGKSKLIGFVLHILSTSPFYDIFDGHLDGHSPRLAPLTQC